jgi:hypothetical protein
MVFRFMSTDKIVEQANMITKINKSELSDLDFSALPDGFAIIFDGDVPIGAITKFSYYQYINKLISKVKDYVQQKQTNR